MDFLQQVGFVQISSASYIGPVLASGSSVPLAHRVFDLAMSTTGAVNSVLLYPALDAAGTTGNPAVSLGGNIQFLHTDVGYLFTYGCWCRPIGTTATVNFITEVR